MNITYKILYNDAVAMTGGQPTTALSVAGDRRAAARRGRARIEVVTDDPSRYTRDPLPDGVRGHDRDDLDAVQRELRETPGCTVIVYDQVCATELRRRRKRGLAAKATRRVLINELSARAAATAARQSNCVAVEPLETEHGVKRAVNQSACNVDQSCVKGFCPSFVTVEGARAAPAAGGRRRGSRPDRCLAQSALPRPRRHR